MPYMTNDQAAAEVSKWNVEVVNLKPALVTREDLRKLYKDENNNYLASIAKLGVTAATAALTGSEGFHALEWPADIVKDTAKDAALEKLAEKGVDWIAGAHLTDLDLNNKKTDYALEANNKFVTKLAAGFLTVLVAAAGGTLTAATGGGVAVVTAIAFIVYLGDKDAAAQKKRRQEIVDSMAIKYDKMRQAKFVEIKDKRRAELERLIMSNGFQDQEDSGLVKTYTWHAGKQTIVARYSKRRLDQLRQRMGQVGGVLAKSLLTIDMLEISRVYRDETAALWQAHDEKEGLAQK